jgi:hypothetical protein
MAYPFAAAEVLTAANLNAMIGAPTQNNQTGTTYTLALLDAGKTVTLSNASPVTVTVPAQATVTWIAETQINLLNIGAGLVTISPAAGVTINGTPLTLATNKGGSLIRTASNTWTFIPLGSGVENANFSDAATGTYTSGGIDYKYVTFNSTGTLTVTTAGLADILLVGGGGAGGDEYSGGGGGGALVSITSGYLPSGSVTVTVGGGGAGANSSRAGGIGSTSSVGQYIAIGGGGGGARFNTTSFPVQASGGACGGGGSNNSTTLVQGAVAIPGFGYAGGTGTDSAGSSAGAGGGGMGAVGGNAASNTGGNGGAGVSNSITNTSLTYCGGGGGGCDTGTAGTATDGGADGSLSTGDFIDASANRGGGGGGTGNAATRGGNGGSGVVIVRVRTN